MTTLTGTEQDDEIFGTAGDDQIEGLGGNDQLYGQEGSDTLLGGAGNDLLDGGTGADRMEGGTGDDSYVVDDAGDEVVELAGEGYDRVMSYVDYTLGANVEGLRLMGSALVGIGNELGNELIGNELDNRLEGLAGNDHLDGGAGADTLVGGTGDDHYYHVEAVDTLVEAAGEGYDTVWVGTDWTLAEHFENLRLTGSASVSGTGNAATNYIYGNAGANTLSGLDGNDVLEGGDGTDTIYGGDGNDTIVDVGGGLLYGDNGDDAVFTQQGAGSWVIDGGAGQDTASLDWFAWSHGSATHSGGTWTVQLGAGDTAKFSNVERVNFRNGVFLKGAETGATLEGVGTDWLIGGGGHDTIRGAAGHDKLDGGAGDDLIVGGDTSDYYDWSSGGLYVWQDDIIDGGDGNDTIDGGYGRDTVRGGNGDDTIYAYGTIHSRIYGDAGNDTIIAVDRPADHPYAEYREYHLYGGAGNDVIYGSSHGNAFYDGKGSDTVYGGNGVDSFYAELDQVDYFHGGAGNDWVNVQINIDYVDVERTETGVTVRRSAWGSDRIETTGIERFEFFGGAYAFGTDAAETFSFSWGKNTAYAGGGNDRIWGAEKNDELHGEDGNDQIIDSRGGDDFVYGGAGNDSIQVAGGLDVVHGGDGDDYIAAGVGRTLARGDHVTVHGDAGHDQIYTNGSVTAYGGAGNDTLSGDGYVGDQHLDGGDGDDTILGGEGADTLLGGLGVNTLDGDDGDDVAVFTGNLADYLLESPVFGEWVIQRADGSEVTTVRNVETIRFADQDMAGGPVYWRGTDGDDVAQGSAARDNFIDALGGNDTIHADAGDDLIQIAYGDDTVFAGAGQDRIEVNLGVAPESLQGYVTVHGEAGDDVMEVSGDGAFYGGDGNDVINAGDWNRVGNQLMDGGAGDDQLTGGAGNDTLVGGLGNNQLAGQEGWDIAIFDGAMSDYSMEEFYGNQRVRRLDGQSVDEVSQVEEFRFADGRVVFAQSEPLNYYSGEGNDTIHGSVHGDLVDGGAGDDQVYGYGGSDLLFGGAGNDRLDGGESDDQLFGGFGADTFVASTGVDLVGDFELAGGDVVDLATFVQFTSFADVQAALSQNGTDAMLNLGDGSSLTLQNVDAATLTSQHFLLAA